MKSLIKCPNCGKRFDVYNVLLSKQINSIFHYDERKNVITCKNCNKEFIPEKILYRRIYEFFIPFIVLIIFRNIEGNMVIKCVTIIISFLLLALLFDLIPHRFNRYIEYTKNKE